MVVGFPPSKGSADGFRFAFMLQPRLLYLPRRAANFTDIKTAIFDGTERFSFWHGSARHRPQATGVFESLLQRLWPGEELPLRGDGFVHDRWNGATLMGAMVGEAVSVETGALLAEELYGYGHRVYNENGTNLADPLVFRQLADDRRMEVRRVMDEMMQCSSRDIRRGHLIAPRCSVCFLTLSVCQGA